MTDWPELDQFLRTDPRDVGCDQALQVLHVYVDLVLSETAESAGRRYPESPRTCWRADRAPTTMTDCSPPPAGLPGMAELGLLTVTAADGQDLLAAAAAGWSRPVPDCPGWTPPTWSATWARSWAGWRGSSPLAGPCRGRAGRRRQRTAARSQPGTRRSWTGR